MQLRVKLDTLDEELMLKRMTLKLGTSFTLTTPITACDKKIAVGPINEIYTKFSLERLEKVNSDEQYETITNRYIQTRKRPNSLNLLILDYTDEDIPHKKHVGFLSDIENVIGDIVVTPIWSEIIKKYTGDRLVEIFLKLTNQFLDLTETHNNKSIIGLIPRALTRQQLDKIMNNYYNRDITSFMIDFRRRSADATLTWIRHLLRLVNEYGLSESSFLYSINPRIANFSQKAKEVIAKDFISFNFGIDILGRIHISAKMPKDEWKKFKESRSGSSLRLFNEKSYGYKTMSKKELVRLNIVPKVSSLKETNFRKQFSESFELQNKLVEENTIEPYLKTKSQIDNKMMLKIKNVRTGAFKKITRKMNSFFK